MATGLHMDEKSVDCLGFGHCEQDRKVSAKSVTMRAMTLCIKLISIILKEYRNATNTSSHCKHTI